MQTLLFKVFSDLAETASFSQAARRSAITQSAVSQQIKALEKHFGVRFIDRGKKNFSLTPEGRVFLGAAREILAVVDSLDVRLREMREVVAGDLRLASVLSVGLHELPPFTRQFTRQYPQVKIHTEYLRSSEVYAAVLAGRAEAGLVAYPQARRGLTSEVLWRDRLVLVCSPSHRLARRSRVPLAELAGEKFIAFAADLPTRKALDRALRAARVSMRPAMEFDNIETVKRAVEIDDAVSILPETVLANERRAGSLISLEITSNDMWRPVGVITRRNRTGGLALRRLLELLRSAHGAGKLAKRRAVAD
ncbi:MAG: LysR family transcriptional regulator [Chthoniobacterales bacterium]|nr:LysR family transcriptional regulator [Chthoniobacterales bacterium]